MPSVAKARLAMIAATLVWGSTFVLMQRALAELPMLHLLMLRFTLGGLTVAMMVNWRQLTVERGRFWRDGLLTGFLLWSGYVLQTGGLYWTTPARSAFVTGLAVILVPVLSSLAPAGGASSGAARPGLRQAAGGVAALAGLWALYLPASSGASGGATGGGGFNRGDALTAGGALVFAIYILVVERAVRRQPLRPLAVVQFGVVAALSACSLAWQPLRPAALSPRVLLTVLATGLLATAGAFLCQLYGQRHLSAVETAVWLTLEPVFAATTSVALGAEPLTATLVAGGALVVVAMVLVQESSTGEATVAL